VADLTSALPITDDDETLRRVVEQAEIPALLCALAAATGDLSLLRDDLRPDEASLMLPAAGLAAPQMQAARDAAFDALVAYRDAGCPQPERPDHETLRALVPFVTGEEHAERYLPLFREELAVDVADPRAPAWSLDELAPDSDLSVVVIGAGMSGLLAAHRLRQAGVPVTVLEKNDDVGGTWLENTYPGCRVDVANSFYSYSCAQRLDWPQYFSTQSVLLDYFRQCADDWDLHEVISFGVEVTSAAWLDDDGCWEVTTRAADGSEATLRASAVVSAVGQLNRPLMPAIEGIDRFAGDSFHSARWDHDVSLAGKRVGVVGTGATGAQVIPAIADLVGELTIFQRTPAWFIPTPTYYQDVSDEQHWLFRHVPAYSHWHRFWLFWANAEGMLPMARVDDGWERTDSVGLLNDALRQVLTAYLEGEFGDDPELLATLTPDYPPAAKRVIRDDGIWARTLGRDHVHLVTDGIAEITERGVRSVDGTERDLDVIIYCTGFQASRFLTPMQVTGRGGIDLHEQWDGDARAYLGMTIPGFPNLFLMYGPNTNIVINGSIIFFSECETTYLVDAVRHLAETAAKGLDVRREVHDEHNRRVDEENAQMAWGASTVNSWYRNEHGRSAQNWPFSLLEFWERTSHLDADDYEVL
jgi:4-hydroxyacetophenone monooxygenase